MPRRPLDPETLQLIDAVRDALADCVDVQEKTMFGCHVFMVNGKMCLGVENDELLVRLPPDSHAQVAEMAGVRPLSSKGLMDGYFLVGPSGYATRPAWQYWIQGALSFNPLAKATPKRKKADGSAPESGKLSPSTLPSTPPAEQEAASTAPGKTGRLKTHPIFGSE